MSNNPDPAEITDGYHTMAELYMHRHRLFICLMQFFPDYAWKDRDGEGTYPGWFLAGINHPHGQISYHLPIELWDDVIVTGPNIRPEFDGHTSDDVLDRLRALSKIMSVRFPIRIREDVTGEHDLEAIFDEWTKSAKPIMLMPKPSDNLFANERRGAYVEHAQKKEELIFCTLKWHDPSIKIERIGQEEYAREVVEKLGLHFVPHGEDGECLMDREGNRLIAFGPVQFEHTEAGFQMTQQYQTFPKVETGQPTP